MYLVIDAGNSRTKYGCHDGQQWLARGFLEDAPAQIAADFQPQRIVVASVAGPERVAAVQAFVARWSCPVEWLRASEARCGLRCDYEKPAALGPDRWAAAIAAWQMLQRDCLVVVAGTATTVDVVRQPGVFAGGCILPGLNMMFESLERGTAGLPFAQGDMQVPARNTHNAIHTGCMLAQVGAIKEMARCLPAHSPIIVAGGAADALAPLLGPQAQIHHWLVLEGLLAVAQGQ